MKKVFAYLLLNAAIT